MDISDFIIFLVVFLLIMWLQYNDDKKFNKDIDRTSLYDKIKIPLVSALFVILIKNLDINKCTNFVHSIMVIKSPPIINNKISNFRNILDDIYLEPANF